MNTVHVIDVMLLAHTRRYYSTLGTYSVFFHCTAENSMEYALEVQKYRYRFVLNTGFFELSIAYHI
jgi:hypothetical protein